MDQDIIFNKIFKILIDQDIDGELCGADVSFLLEHKGLFKDLWNYDSEKDFYNLKPKEDDFLKKWYKYKITMSTSLSEDDKWSLENFDYKFLLLYKLKEIFGG